MDSDIKNERQAMDKPSILVIDDETNLLRFFEYNIKGMGFDVVIDSMGSYVVYAREKTDVLPNTVREILDRIGRPIDAA